MFPKSTMAGTWFIPVLLSGVLAYTATATLPMLADPPLKVGAFNIQVFGARKYKDDNVHKYLIEILKRYDLLLVQEIRDREMKYMPKLLADVNSKIADVRQQYNMTISERLGTTNIKEQYAYVYRMNRLRVLKTYQYPDNGQFERPPFVASFESNTTELEQFTIIGDHTKPTKAKDEINNLRDVYDIVLKEFGDIAKNILIAGDLNADCSYLHKEEKTKLRVSNGLLFKWLIKEDTDTTVGNSDCAYDRFITSGTGWKGSIVPGSIGIFNFETEYGLNHELAEDVSDHFPVEFDLQGKQHEENQYSTKAQMSVEITNKEEVSLKGIKKLYYKPIKLPKSWEIKVFKYNNKNHHVEASIQRQVADSVMSELEDFNTKIGVNVLNPRTISFVRSYIKESSFGKQSSVYGIKVEPIRTYDLTVTCGLVAPYICSVRVTKLEFNSN